ncbi:aspartate carbamoyltransferase regulatory subunit [Candidatus Uhrbacteria bacterium]|nr:aspartate carbamoyltransferase regulatory subunit [Candidatus Uhrbacteria bacterium]
MQQQKHQLRHVSAIKNGYVIDHIPTGQGLRILALLNLAIYPKVITVGLNLPSKRIGKKDIIKLEDRSISNEEESRIALLAPGATMARIRNYAVIKKKTLEIPSEITGLLRCPNRNCITNYEAIDTLFHVYRAGTQLRMHCTYCERVFHQQDMTDLSQLA